LRVYCVISRFGHNSNLTAWRDKNAIGHFSHYVPCCLFLGVGHFSRHTRVTAVSTYVFVWTLFRHTRYGVYVVFIGHISNQS
jgi:hypothetical protein